MLRHQFGNSAATPPPVWGQVRNSVMSKRFLSCRVSILQQPQQPQQPLQPTRLSIPKTSLPIVSQIQFDHGHCADL